jgi:hypothetical protein
MTCWDATITCPNTQSIGITYGWSFPSGSNFGTIVMFSGGPGTAPSEYADDIPAYAANYQTNYVVIQIEYDSAWEDPTNSNGGNVLNAACRPATFLNWVNNNSALHSTGAMCAQGSSAGSAAIAYSLAWYGSSSYLKNVELLSGPVLSEVDQGCTYPNALNMTICGTDQQGNKQYGCTPATTQWADNVIYVPNYNQAVSTFTGLSGCAQSSGQGNLAAWQQMSIVDGSSGAVRPTFSYPSINMHGWVCASYAQGQCTAPHCPNNSAAQGNYFYQQFSSSQTPASFKLTGVLSCVQEEGVKQGIDPDTLASGLVAVSADMTNKCRTP